MKKLILAAMLFFIASCGSGNSSGSAADKAKTPAIKGNSTGSNIVEMDTMRMDTGYRKTQGNNH